MKAFNLLLPWIAGAAITCPISAKELLVPADHATIQAAIDAAMDGDHIIVAPGTYREALVLDGKSILLRSEYLANGEVATIENTILSGVNESGEDYKNTVLKIGTHQTQDSRICGFTIRDGDDGISCGAVVTIDHNRFINNKDAIDYEGGGGVCADNLFELNRDDAVDLDGSCALILERNLIRNNRDDGIEIRLEPHHGKLLKSVFTDNLIYGNGEDGIQFIDYDAESDRQFVIQRNVISNSDMAGIGCMDNTNTREDYRAAKLDEDIWIVDNWFIDNAYGVSGGGNIKLFRNTFNEHRQAAVLGFDAGADAALNRFANNARNLLACEGLSERFGCECASEADFSDWPLAAWLKDPGLPWTPVQAANE